MTSILQWAQYYKMGHPYLCEFIYLLLSALFYLPLAGWLAGWLWFLLPRAAVLARANVNGNNFLSSLLSLFTKQRPSFRSFFLPKPPVTVKWAPLCLPAAAKPQSSPFFLSFCLIIIIVIIIIIITAAAIIIISSSSGLETTCWAFWRQTETRAKVGMGRNGPERSQARLCFWGTNSLRVKFVCVCVLKKAKDWLCCCWGQHEERASSKLTKITFQNNSTLRMAIEFWNVFVVVVVVG